MMCYWILAPLTCLLSIAYLLPIDYFRKFLFIDRVRWWHNIISITTCLQVIPRMQCDSQINSLLATHCHDMKHITFPRIHILLISISRELPNNNYVDPFWWSTNPINWIGTICTSSKIINCLWLLCTWVLAYFN